jgi:hypothetical protein
VDVIAGDRAARNVFRFWIHTGKPFGVEVQNAKGEILTANDLQLVTVKS